MVIAGKRNRQPEPDVVPDIDLSTVSVPMCEVFNPYRVKPLEGQIRDDLLGIKELAGSMSVLGQLMPILVSKVKGDSRYDAHLVDGERRLAACRLLKRPIKAYLWDGKTDPKTIYAMCVAANFGRQPHNCIEVCHGIERLKEDGRTVTEIATIFTRSEGWVDQHYMLRRLHREVQAMMVPMVFDDQSESNGNGHAFKALSIGSRKLKPRLSFMNGLMLSRLPPGDQVIRANHIVEKEMSQVQARRYILGVAKENPQAKKRERSPAEQRYALLSIANGTYERFGIYTDMHKRNEFLRLLADASEGELVSLQETLHDTAVEIAQLWKVVKEVNERLKTKK